MQQFLLTLLLSFNVSAKVADVLGQDTRYRVDSSKNSFYQSIGFLQKHIYKTKKFNYCTGTIVSTRHVVTAAHCVILDGEVTTEISFTPGLNDEFRKRKGKLVTFKAIKVRVLEDYLESGAVRDDLALITFEEDLPAAAQDLGPLTEEDQILKLAGYPKDKPMGTLWEGQGKRRYSFNGRATVDHNIDTEGGQSGSAIRTSSAGKEVIVGIHSGHDTSIFQYTNRACFFTERKLKKLYSWMREDIDK